MLCSGLGQRVGQARLETTACGTQTPCYDLDCSSGVAASGHKLDISFQRRLANCLSAVLAARRACAPFRPDLADQSLHLLVVLST